MAKLRCHHHGAIAAERRRTDHRGLRIVASSRRDVDRVQASGIEKERTVDRKRAEAARRARRERAAGIDRHGERIDDAGAGKRACGVDAHIRRSGDDSVHEQKTAIDGGGTRIDVRSGQRLDAAGECQSATASDRSRKDILRRGDSERLGPEPDYAALVAGERADRCSVVCAGNVEHAAGRYVDAA
jgi:hypothetical protein